MNIKNRALHFAVVIAMMSPYSTAWADSLFSRAAADNGTLISDQKVRFEVGDIVTVVVQEAVQASTTAGTDTTKESTLEGTAPVAGNGTLVGGAGFGLFPKELLPNWNVDVSNEHTADGTTRRSNQLTMTVSCVVTEVMENGNIRIEGEKHVTVNRENTEIILSGIARARDITPANTVLSTQLANADVKLKGAGPLWNNQRRGLLTKLFDWLSPF